MRKKRLPLQALQKAVRDLCTAEMELEIYSGANSRTEVNGILDDVATVLTAVRLDMKAAGFAAFDQEITEVRTNQREIRGYSATLRLEVQLQDMEG